MGFVFEVFAVLIRVLVDQTVSVVPKLTEEERFEIIETLSGNRSETRDHESMVTSRTVGESGQNQTFSYVQDRGMKESLTVSEIADRVRAAPDGEHLVWKRGMTGWADPTSLSIFDGLFDSEAVTDEPTG